MFLWYCLYLWLFWYCRVSQLYSYCFLSCYGSFILHGTGTGTGTGNGNGKKGFLYVMQTCSYCREGGLGPGGGTGTGNLAMGSIPIFPVLVLVVPLPVVSPIPSPGSMQCERAIRPVAVISAMHLHVLCMILVLTVC